jgi:ABC-type sulfate transport system permease subunit
LSPVEIREGICFSTVPFEAREVDPLVFEKTNSSQVPAKLLVFIDLVETKWN